MDPLTHIVVGRAVVAAADGEAAPGRGVAAAAILGALSPDIDAAVAFWGWDRYVRIHEIGTHSIAGALLMACLTAVVVRAVIHLRSPTGAAPHRLSTSFAALFGAATAGALSHIILDLACGGRIRLGWPLVQDRLSVPLVAMADPWFVAICVVGLLGRWPGRRPLRRVSRAIIAAAIVLLAAKGVLLARALRSSHLDPSLSAVQPHWGSMTEWSAFERTEASVRAWTISSGGEPPTLSMSRPLAPDAPRVHASRSLDAVQNFLSVHEFSFPVERATGHGRTEVLWSDLRYCWPASARVQPQRASARQVQSRDDDIACGVWVGCLFGTDSLVLTQVVKIAAVVQTRPARR